MDILRRYEGITFHSSSDWSRARSFAKVIHNATVRSSFVTLLLTNNTVRRLPCLWTTTVLRHVLIVALGVHVRNDRPYTHATLHGFNMCEKY